MHMVSSQCRPCRPAPAPLSRCCSPAAGQLSALHAPPVAQQHGAGGLVSLEPHSVPAGKCGGTGTQVVSPANPTALHTSLFAGPCCHRRPSASHPLCAAPFLATHRAATSGRSIKKVMPLQQQARCRRAGGAVGNHAGMRPAALGEPRGACARAHWVRLQACPSTMLHAAHQIRRPPHLNPSGSLSVTSSPPVKNRPCRVQGSRLGRSDGAHGLPPGEPHRRGRRHPSCRPGSMLPVRAHSTSKQLPHSPQGGCWPAGTAARAWPPGTAPLAAPPPAAARQAGWSGLRARAGTGQAPAGGPPPPQRQGAGPCGLQRQETGAHTLGWSLHAT